ncbi:MAG: EAL domain-containing protein [Gammaproteobacteria bacterium]|nr:EAL domain-containing protein [Gammaproteobacteria bacterium]
MATLTNLNTATPAMDGVSHLEDPAVMDSALYQDAGCTYARFNGLRLGSYFQPIFSLAHQRVVGFEALMRATDPEGRPRGPHEVFDGTRGHTDTVVLDRLCRAIHLYNFARQDTGSAWLFLNINPRVIAEGRRPGSFLQARLEQLELPPQRVVIEVVEAALTDETLLVDAVRRYRDLGCLIAIDDFGAGHSNFDRICRLRPDIVKLDRSIVAQAAVDPGIRSIVPGMVSLLHESGSLVVMEGIETEYEAMVAMDADADFVQGYYFARPMPQAAVVSEPRFDALFDRFRDMTLQERTGYRTEIAPYLNSLGYASVLLQSSHPLEIACKGFLELARAERCFLLDGEGRQIGANVNSPHSRLESDPCFTPLRDADGANWSRRHYFRRAISRPEKVQVTRPYLSAATATPCITISIAFKIRGERRVLCGDLRWDEGYGSN